MTVYFFLLQLIKGFCIACTENGFDFSKQHLSDSDLFFTGIDFCMPDVIQGFLLNFSLSLETFFNVPYLSRIKLILLRKL